MTLRRRCDWLRAGLKSAKVGRCERPCAFFQASAAPLALAASVSGTTATERRFAPPAGEPVLDVFDVSLLARIESSGFSLADLIGRSGQGSTAALRRASPAYRTIMDAVGADVRTLRAEMAGNGADFICQELPADITGERARGYGFCTPTYFMFQMRIDNHPSPRG